MYEVLSLIFGLQVVLAPEYNYYETKWASPEAEVEWFIRETAPKFGVDVEDALRVLQCESRLDRYAKNPNSSAKGVGQFINKTWENYCGGDVYDYQDNVICFMDVYSVNPQWWECS